MVFAAFERKFSVSSDETQRGSLNIFERRKIIIKLSPSGLVLGKSNNEFTLTYEEEMLMASENFECHEDE